MDKLRSVVALLVSILLCFGAAALGSIATAPAVDGWYRTLAKPEWTPPASVFGPVWTTLYLMMAVAAWLVWRTARQASERSASDGARKPGLAFPLSLFALQLALNVAWSWIFFGMKSPGWSVVEIAALWLCIAATAFAFFGRSQLAGWLLIPYLGWVTYAAALNAAIWRMNSA